MLRRWFLAALLIPAAARGDEGMWTFDRPPLEPMRAAIGFAPNQAWLDHLRLSTVVFGEGGTGAFVSGEGLVLTNHHLAHGHLQRLSSSGRDLVKEGFVARARNEEIRVPGLALKVLVSTVDVTAEARRAGRAREEILEGILRRETESTGLACERVDFPEGEHWIYRYRVFGDVRLVMAPEYDAAAFGKEWDNFAWPRHDLDFALFRVYENGRPYRPAHRLAWGRRGVSLGDPTFVAGHPGRTHRRETFAQFDFRRRVVDPLMVRTLERRAAILEAYARRGGEQARRVSPDLLETFNFLKVYREEIRGLQDAPAMERLLDREKALRNRLDRDPAWTALPLLFRRQEALAREYQLLHGSYCSLERGPLHRALRLVRLVSAPAPSDEDRREWLEPEPLDRELETLLLAGGLTETLEWLGPAHPLTRAVLADGRPDEVAAQAIGRTRIDDPAFVRGLIDGGPSALASCDDPLVRMAMRLDPLSRDVQRRYEALETQVEAHNARLAQTRAAVEGRASYPDATFTLRFGYGSVQGYPAEGTLQQPFTTFGGLFDRADAWGPAAEGGSWTLPPRWIERRPAIDPSTPLNLVTTNDITGGSSGSPVVDRRGELVGLVFDGNIHSIPGRFYYDPGKNRCIAVDARAILEALAKVYDAAHLVQELTEPPPPAPPSPISP